MGVIAHVVEPETGGVPNVAEKLARTQVQAGWDVVYIGHPTSPVRAGLERAGVDYWARNLKSVSALGTNASAIRHAAAVADVLHFHSSRSGLFRALIPRTDRPPTIFSPHGWGWLSAPQALTRIYGWVERALALYRTDHIHVLTPEELTVGSSVISSNAVTWHVIPNGVDLNSFTRTELIPPRRVFSSEAPLRLLCVGRICTQKGQDLLLAAIDGLPPADASRLRITLAGDGPMLATLRDRYAHLPIVYLSDPADIPALYRAADLVALPSRWEGQPLVLLEALASGCAALCTDAASGTTYAPYVYRVDPSTASLQAAVQFLLNHPAHLEVLRRHADNVRPQLDETSIMNAHLRLARKAVQRNIGSEVSHREHS